MRSKPMSYANKNLTKEKIMRKLVILLVLSGALTAHAETKYYIDGKEVNKAQAIMQALKDPRIEVLKVQANWTRLNPQTANLKKTRDASIADIPKSK